jgi:hypothetical protein
MVHAVNFVLIEEDPQRSPSERLKVTTDSLEELRHATTLVITARVRNEEVVKQWVMLLKS